jgi:hypothetical protein
VAAEDRLSASVFILTAFSVVVNTSFMGTSSSHFGDQLVSTCDSSSRPRIMSSIPCSQRSQTLSRLTAWGAWQNVWRLARTGTATRPAQRAAPTLSGTQRPAECGCAATPRVHRPGWAVVGDRTQFSPHTRQVLMAPQERPIYPSRCFTGSPCRLGLSGTCCRCAQARSPLRHGLLRA